MTIIYVQYGATDIIIHKIHLLMSPFSHQPITHLLYEFTGYLPVFLLLKNRQVYIISLVNTVRFYHSSSMLLLA